MNERVNRRSEKWIERALQAGVNDRGGVAVKLSDPGRNGLPDRLVLWPGGVAEFVELKSLGGKRSALQTVTAQQLKELGFDYTLIDSELKLETWLNSNHGRIRRN